MLATPKVSDCQKNSSLLQHSVMKLDRSNKFNLCYYGQVNLIPQKLSAASKWASILQTTLEVTFILLVMVHLCVYLYIILCMHTAAYIHTHNFIATAFINLSTFTYVLIVLNNLLKLIPLVITSANPRLLHHGESCDYMLSSFKHRNKNEIQKSIS